jgi:hypothetical protein
LGAGQARVSGLMPASSSPCLGEKSDFFLSVLEFELRIVLTRQVLYCLKHGSGYFGARVQSGP